MFGVFSVVFAAVLCAGCGGKKGKGNCFWIYEQFFLTFLLCMWLFKVEEAPPAQPETPAPGSQLAPEPQADVQPVESKKSGIEPKSQIGSKVRYFGSYVSNKFIES